MLQKCSHQSQIEHMLRVHFKCVPYVITMKSLGSFNQSSQCSQHVITGFRPPCPQCIEVFLEEADEDLEMNDLPLLKNTSPLPVLAPVISGFVPFAVSTSQHCIPPKSFLRKVWHPYWDSVGQCCCEPGGWCNDLPCAGWVWCIPHNIWGCSSLDGGCWSGRSCCGTDKEPCDQQGALCSGCTPTHTLCPGSLELCTVGAREDGWEGSSTRLGWGGGNRLFQDVGSEVDWVVSDWLYQSNRVLVFCLWAWIRHKWEEHKKDKHKGER